MVYREACVDYSTVCRWVSSLKGGDPTESILRDQKRSGKPLSPSNAANQKAVHKIILDNRPIEQKDIAKELEISKERVQHIIKDILGYRNVSAKWVPRMLTDEMKIQRKTTCAESLKHYEEEGENFIQRIVTGDVIEPWVHHYDPREKTSVNGIQAQELSFSEEIQSCCLCQKSDADYFLGLRGNCSYKI
ncbi:histone-lysine n-methyltransferase setmar-like protein [Elysia marginata]|uniref:Histone-lysine n-methyltransferase setmar-like protein n=1 Tax=Elysia marginata TaxID=1093978 RepID=A0AAV4IAX9_9GAST|nr:histone-lysine n-methyltransferase setmar-like protein [Elysia marginata]